MYSSGAYSEAPYSAEVESGAPSTEHNATGALVGPGSTLAGSALHTPVHNATGVLVGQGSTVAGSALRQDHASAAFWRDDFVGSGNLDTHDPDIGNAYTAVNGSLADIEIDGNGGLPMTAQPTGVPDPLAIRVTSTLPTSATLPYTMRAKFRIDSFDEDSTQQCYIEMLAYSGSDLVLGFTLLFYPPSGFDFRADLFVRATGPTFYFDTPDITSAITLGDEHVFKAVVTSGGVDFLVDDVSIGSTALVPIAPVTKVEFAPFDGDYANPGSGLHIDGTLHILEIYAGEQEHVTTGALVGPGSALSGTAVHNRTHVTDGVLVGSGSTLAGEARILTHHASGVLVGAGSTLEGSAYRTRVHDAEGELTGAGSTLAGAAYRTHVHACTAELVGQGSVVVGSAYRTRVHVASGALTGPGSVVDGAAYRTRVHASSGSLTGGGSTLSGTAVYNAKHAATGALVGPGSVLTGEAARRPLHIASGALVGPGSTVVGQAKYTARHSASGALTGGGSTLSGAARLMTHHVSGVLVGAGSVLAGAAYRTRLHVTSGVLTGQGSSLSGSGGKTLEVDDDERHDIFTSVERVNVFGSVERADLFIRPSTRADVAIKTNRIDVET